MAECTCQSHTSNPNYTQKNVYGTTASDVATYSMDNVAVGQIITSDKWNELRNLVYTERNRRQKTGTHANSDTWQVTISAVNGTFRTNSAYTRVNSRLILLQLANNSNLTNIYNNSILPNFVPDSGYENQSVTVSPNIVTTVTKNAFYTMRCGTRNTTKSTANASNTQADKNAMDIYTARIGDQINAGDFNALIQKANYGTLNTVTTGALIKASDINTAINNLINFGKQCVCNCDYCTCNCNYCTCNCNYCTCNCDHGCICTCNYHFILKEEQK